MPSGSVFQLSNFTASANEGIGFQSMATNGQHWNTSIPNRLYLANVDMMGAPYGSYGGTARFSNMGNASECALWLCVNEYQTSSHSGTQVQHVVSSFDEIHYRPDTEIVNYTFRYPNDAVGAGRPAYVNYTVSDFAAAALREQFSGSGTSDSSLVDGVVSLRTNGHFASSSLISGIWAGTQNQNQWIQALALSMSNVMRTESMSSRKSYNGTAYVTAIGISWPWIVLPACCVAGTIPLLISVMIRTSRSSIKAWRGSPLTLLMFSIDEDILRVAQDVDSDNDPFYNITVSLDRVGQGSWQLVSQEAI